MEARNQIEKMAAEQKAAMDFVVEREPKRHGPPVPQEEQERAIDEPPGDAARRCRNGRSISAGERQEAREKADS